MDDLQKVSVASLYLEGRADSCFMDYQSSRNVVSWEDFVTDVCDRFEDIHKSNYIGHFNKLIQTGSVEDYFTQFEDLKSFMTSKNPSFTDEYFVLSFLSGLKEEIRIAVQMFQPSTLNQAFYLAKLQEIRHWVDVIWLWVLIG
ncbi:hypothetical protein ACHQM5_021078 [Ranunculus cassubicifolius]